MMILVASWRLLELVPIVEHVEDTIELHLARVAQIHPHILRARSHSRHYRLAPRRLKTRQIGPSPARCSHQEGRALATPA